MSSFTKSNPIKITNKSIEDIQFSSSDPNAFAFCSSDGTIRLLDIRNPDPNQHLRINASNYDVNVISWNNRSPNLLASGDDDGEFKIWDLRFIGKDPVTSIHWH